MSTKQTKDLEKKLRKVEKELDDCKKKLRDKTTAFDKLDKEHAALDGQYADLDRDYNHTKELYDDLKDAVPVISQTELDKLREELQQKTLECEIAQNSTSLPTDVTTLQAELANTKKDLEQQIQRGDDLECQNDQMRKQLEANEIAGRSGKRNMKERIEAIGKDDLYPVRDTINNHVTRVIIFLENDSDLAEALEICYEKCPDTIKEKYEEPEFMALFGDLLRKILSDWKNQVQGKAKDAAQLWWEKHGGDTTPTADDVLEVLQMTQLDLDKAENKGKKELLIWFMDKYLPSVAITPKDAFDEAARLEYMPTDKYDLDGELKMRISTAQYAFALLQLDNCEEKWPKIFKMKKDNPNWHVPRTKADGADEYAGKFSDSMAGQSIYGGWSEEGTRRMSELQDLVADYHAKEKANGWDTYKYVIQELVKLKEEKDASDATKGKKRKKLTKKKKSARKSNVKRRYD